MKFDNINPMDPDQLYRWFYLNGMHGYLSLPAYPGSAAEGANAELRSQVSSAKISQPSHAEASE